MVLTRREFEQAGIYQLSTPTYASVEQALAIKPWKRWSAGLRRWMLCRYAFDAETSTLSIVSSAIVVVPDGTSSRYERGRSGGVWVMRHGSSFSIGADPVFCARHMWRVAPHPLR